VRNLVFIFPFTIIYFLNILNIFLLINILNIYHLRPFLINLRQSIFFNLQQDQFYLEPANLSVKNFLDSNSILNLFFLTFIFLFSDLLYHHHDPQQSIFRHIKELIQLLFPKFDTVYII